MNSNCRYDIMRCEPEQYRVPAGYELVPIGTEEASGMKYCFLICGSTYINDWFSLSTLGYAKRLITREWCPTARKIVIVDDNKPFKVNFEINKR